MTNRIQTSKKLRFEVLKRDKFTCQYCGRKSPQFRMEADHVIPVCEGGLTHMLNLTTACFDCNRGKGKNPLSHDFLSEKQREQPEIGLDIPTIKYTEINLTPASSSFEDILQSWISYYDGRIPMDSNDKRECFLVLLDTLARHGYTKDDITVEKKMQIVKLCVKPSHRNKFKLRKWIQYTVLSLRDAITSYYGILDTKLAQVNS